MRPRTKRMGLTGRGLSRGWRLQFGGALELAAGSKDVAPARAADERRNACGNQDLLEGLNSLVGRRVEGNIRPGIEGDQVYFRAQPFEERCQFARVLLGIIDAGQQHVLK